MFTSLFDILGLVTLALGLDLGSLPRLLLFGAPRCVSLRLIRSPDFSAAAFAVLDAFLPIARATALPALLQQY